MNILQTLHHFRSLGRAHVGAVDCCGIVPKKMTDPPCTLQPRTAYIVLTLVAIIAPSTKGVPGSYSSSATG